MGIDFSYLSYVFKGIEADPNYAPLYCLGGDYYKSRNISLSVWFYERAIQCDINKSISVFKQPVYWNELPKNKLMLLYEETGDIEKSRDYARELGDNFADMILTARIRSENFNKYPQPIRLNLGSDGQKKVGFIACDICHRDADMHFDMKEIPFPDRSVDTIYTEHAIEHLDFRGVMQFLEEVGRVLKIGGMLTIKAPCLLDCCRKYVEAVERNDLSDQIWYKKTIYGNQDEGEREHKGFQYHLSGWGQVGLKNFLSYLNITKSVEYDGFRTPSLAIEGYRALMCFVQCPVDRFDDASTRIRRLGLREAVRRKNLQEKIKVEFFLDVEELRSSYLSVAGGWSPIPDIIVFTGFSEEERNCARDYNARGVITIFDHCEDWPMEGLFEMMKIVKLISCCSLALRDKVGIVGGLKDKVVYVPDLPDVLLMGNNRGNEA